ncbi:MAG TPA: DEAD/DEAH box helicase, partial [Candidatus Acidoferrales bacterium]|nr:DEAD/DEAH box helicase [Candidatus Acidoferrales bacterium]
MTEVLERLLDDPVVARSVVAHRVVPAADARFARLPDWVDPRIASGLAARGLGLLWTHQATAADALHAGRDVVVVTPTASGKTLCYNLPVLQAVADDPAARALYLFPTKALGQDQVAAFRELASASGLDVACATYDGDTPAPVRSTVRSAGQVVVTNPDMLHAAILPHHT